MAARLKNKKQRREWNFLLLSIGLHLLTVVTITHAPTPPALPQKTRVEVEYLQPDDLTPPEPPKKVTRAKQALPDQVVEQQKQVNPEKDDDSRFLSAFNQKVIKQTRADHSGKFKNTAKGGQPDEGQKDGEKKPEIEKEKDGEEKSREG